MSPHGWLWELGGDGRPGLKDGDVSSRAARIHGTEHQRHRGPDCSAGPATQGPFGIGLDQPISR